MVYIVETFRYGSLEELKDLVNSFHEVGIKVLGDAVLNHRCAHFQNKNGIWNVFGGRLNWDDRAIVADDPHFQVMFNRIWVKQFICIFFQKFLNYIKDELT